MKEKAPGTLSSGGKWAGLIRLENVLDPSEAIALRRSGGALRGDEAKALLAIKTVFPESRIVWRGSL